MFKLRSVNPSDYQVLGEVEISTADEVAEKVRLAHAIQKTWAHLGVGARVKLLRRAMEDFESKKAEFALLESREMGMPINETRADYAGVFDFIGWYLDKAETYLGPETTFENETEIHQVFREPIGVAAVIIPWNYPFLNFVWGTFQSLLAGNAVVLKHSEEVPLCGKLIENVMVRHLPKGVFSEVYGAGDVGQMLVEQDINLLHFVGSTRTGKRLYESAGKKFIKAVMELGGSAPGIVFGDADIDAAVASIRDFRLSNNGQYCDGLKRLLVHESAWLEVCEKLVAIFSARKVGVAEDETTESGPLVAKRQLDLLIEQVEDASDQGAAVEVGGRSLENELGGAFFQPTVLTGIQSQMRVWQEEVFGPVLPMVPFRSEEEAIRLANDNAYGLGSYVYTEDLERAQRVARQIQSGMVSINGRNYTTPWNPFGGYKGSGMGREHGKYGFREVTQMKVVARPK